MTLAETLRGLARRWYVVVPGVLLALAMGVGAWMMVPPGYQRSASLVLLPGEGSLPETSTNPYLFLGGLTNAADVVVRVIGSEETLGDLFDAHPDLEIEVDRDTSAPGPIILISVTATTDADAAEVLTEVVERTGDAVDQMQAKENVLPDDRLTVTPLAIDETSTLQQRPRIILAGGGAGGLVLVTLALASALGGSRQSRERLPSAQDIKRP